MKITKILKTYFWTVGEENLMLYYRLAKYFQKRGVKLISSYYFRKIIVKYSVYIHPSANVHSTTKFPHPTSIIIGGGVTIHRNTSIYQNVTIGALRKGDWSHDSSYPTIGQNCKIYSGATILGGIEVGDNVIVGASTLVIKSVGKGKTVAGVPAKEISNNKGRRDGK